MKVNNPNLTLDAFKQYVQNYMNEAGQDDVDVSGAQSFDDVKSIIDEYWGWYDEQTVYLLSGFIEEILV
jgi:hypothetical protein